MANEIQELLKDIKDERIKLRLSAAIAELRKTKKFGLVFEEHLPELLPIYCANTRVQALVARRGSNLLTETFVVQKIAKNIATVTPEVGGAPQDIPVAELVVVKRFGEAIFPALRHVESVLLGGNAPHHALIEADNYHALQLLEWLYAGKVDCIYIDPPYNTGARDWKYNNDYVDENDGFRHSKWLSMMKKRLLLAWRLLKGGGMLCITIDDYEAHRLRCLIEQSFGTDSVIGQVAIRNNPSGRSTVSGLSVAHEYALLVSKSAAAKLSRFPRSAEQWGRFKEADEDGPFEWRNFRKDGGATTYRTARPKQYYPIYVQADSFRIPEMSWNKAKRKWDIHDQEKKGELALWPKDDEGNERVWSFSPTSAKARSAELVVRRQGKGVGLARKYRPSEAGVLPRTWWDKREYSAREYGSAALKAIFGETQVFPFAKSPHATRDCLWMIGADNPDALVVDFFSGSGTTMEAVLALNAADNGRRRCVLVTNNEVFPDDRAQQLLAQGLRPNDEAYEREGICRSVTFPRCKYIINGMRSDGTELLGESPMGKLEEQEVRRTVRPLDFTTDHILASKKAREALALTVGFPKSKVTGAESFLMAEGVSTAVLLKATALDEFIEKGEEWADTIETVYLPFASGKAFNQVKKQLTESWPPLIKIVEIKRLMKDGFAANLDYFRLDFLDRSMVETGGKLADILPALWMMAGCRGKLPTCKGNEKMLFFKDCPFAVLVNESAVKPFLARLEERPDVDWAFLVTNDQDSFSRMCEWLPEYIPAVQRVHLWRNYVDNFLINVDHASMVNAP